MKLFFKKQGQGRPIIILHGLFGMLDNWQSISNSLANDFEVWLVDLRNHGRSPHSEAFNYEVMAHDLHEFVEDHGLQGATIVGHSMGGKVAMRYAQLFQNEAGRLIVVDMGVKAYPIHHDVIIAALKRVSPNTISSRKDAEEVLIADIPDFGTRQFLLKNLFWNDSKQLEWRFNLEAIDREIGRIVESLPPTEVRLPTLFIGGGKSNYILKEDFRTIQSIFPNASLVTIENAGHWVHAEAPEAVIHQISNFVA
jgi:esterase